MKETNMMKWEKGEHVYSKPEEKLLSLKKGEKIGNNLSDCTICPIGNSTCLDYFKIEIFGYHPEKHSLKKTLMICSIGISDFEKCPLNK